MMRATKRLDAIELRLRQLECCHTNTKFEQTTCSSFLRGTWEEPIVEVCIDCGKVFRSFSTEREYLEAARVNAMRAVEIAEKRLADED